jgi:hypothetical protein
MPGEVPEASFRLEHGFTMRPDLLGDSGPGRSIAMGQSAPGDALEALYLGKAAETPFRDVWLDTRGAHVVYVMGKRRSGKSFTLGVLAEGLVASGWVNQSEHQQGVLILDTMNVFLTMPFRVDEAEAADSSVHRELRRWRLEPEDLPIRLFHPVRTALPDGVAGEALTLRPSDLSADEWCGLFEADPFADPLGHLITEVHAKVSTDGYIDSSSDGTVPATSEFTIDDLLVALERDADLQRYHRDTRESLRRRLHAVRRSPVFSDEGLDVRSLIRPGEISVLLLRELDHEMRSVLVALIVKRVMELRGISEQHERMIPVHRARAENLADTDPEQAARERELAASNERAARNGLPRTWIIIDEAHNYVPAVGVTPSRRPLKKYVDEGRNLGLSIVVATQQPAGLDGSIQRNADMLLVHSLSHQADIAAAQGMINTAPPEETILDGSRRVSGSGAFEALVRALPIGYALASTDRANRLFPVRIRPRISVHGGTSY